MDDLGVTKIASPILGSSWTKRKTSSFHSPSSSSQHSYYNHHHHQRKHNINNYRGTRTKNIKLQSEGLRNARKTITIVAVLIETMTFVVGVNPPGGFNQANGKALLGKKTTYKCYPILEKNDDETNGGNTQSNVDFNIIYGINLYSCNMVNIATTKWG
ncbi:hypothetical protein H5410_042117 [Solanum commersonii]|uniref:PGG domain-containing protein n=1 Tax=Solanum commersonii TaxID=4109 RepID=A0A9J5XTF7_SOLCO|nr:hypothetical protein H5410_042117 [Solanum commersonii]